MKKILTREIIICDFCKTDVDAVGTVKGSGKDACREHMTAFTKELRFPKELGSEMSGCRQAIDPDYDAEMVINYKKSK